MRRLAIAVSALTLASAASTMYVAPALAGEHADTHVVTGGRLGVVPAKGAGAHAGAHKNPDLLWHNGQIMLSTAVTAIYWGTKWSDPSFVNDKQSGLATFYSSVGGSKYIGTNTEYSGSNGKVTGNVSYSGFVSDPSAAPSGAPQTSTIQAEVAKMITHPVANGYYPVYVDTPRGHAGYCAWHSFGTVSGVNVTFAFFFNLDGDAGCDPVDTFTTHSEGLAALANVSGHELSETLTDPNNGGWWDSSGAENADKCAWTFNGPETLNGSKWLIQGNWSNAAYDHGQTGYTKGGCINGN
jgi:hypothetical protein